MKLRIGHLSTFYHTAVLLMADETVRRGFSFGIEWRLFGTGPAIVAAFERGELDLAYIGLPPAVIGIARGVPLRCIAGGHVEGTVISAKGRYRGLSEAGSLSAVLSQFRGRRIGVPGKGSIHDIILMDCLDRCALTGEVEVVNLPWADLVLEAVIKETVAAAIGTPALAAAVEYYAGGKVLYPPALLWPDNPSYGILATAEFLAREAGAAEEFLSGHEAATAFLRSRPQEAAEVITAYVGVAERELVMRALSISPKYCAALTEGYMASTMAFVEAQKRLGYITRDVSREEIFDLSLIGKVHPEGDHYGDGIAAA